MGRIHSISIERPTPTGAQFAQFARHAPKIACANLRRSDTRGAHREQLRRNACAHESTNGAGTDARWRNQLPAPGPGGPGALPPRGSHRPVRARIRAYGSSNHGFAARTYVEREVRTGASGYRLSKRWNTVQVIERSRLRRSSHLRQRRSASRRKRESASEFPVTP